MLCLLRYWKDKCFIILDITIFSRRLPTDTSIATKDKSMLTFNNWDSWPFIVAFLVEGGCFEIIFTTSVKQLSLELFSNALLKKICFLLICDYLWVFKHITYILDDDRWLDKLVLLRNTVVFVVDGLLIQRLVYLKVGH